VLWSGQALLLTDDIGPDQLSKSVSHDNLAAHGADDEDRKGDGKNLGSQYDAFVLHPQ
jgi:hypothetical protein